MLREISGKSFIMNLLNGVETEALTTVSGKH